MFAFTLSRGFEGVSVFQLNTVLRLCGLAGVERGPFAQIYL